ncbi:MAG: glycoside hydrolase family 3 N-terminal domain-containing protein [bacterium]
MSPIYNKTVDMRVEQILAKMTVEEKIGQLFLVYFKGPLLSSGLKEIINKYHVGGLILYTVSENIKDPVQVGKLINAVQKEAMNHGARIPLFISIDQEGGRVVRLTEGVTVFPGNMAIGATGSLKAARFMAMITAKELKALGINMNFAPVIDVNNNPDNPIIGTRSFGASAEKVANFGGVEIETYRIYGIISTAKHFPGHGDTTIDSHIGIPVIPHGLDRLQSIELLPFQKAIDAGVPAIMTAHVVIPALEKEKGLPATLSYNILTGLLRQKMGFEGLVITDSLGMGGIVKTFSITEASVLALKAGADILLFGADKHFGPEDQIVVYRHILSLVYSGEIPMGRIDESVRRILKAKVQYELFDEVKVNIDEIPQKVGTEKHLELAGSIAKDSITLIKDENVYIPVNSEEPILIIWPQIDNSLENYFNIYHLKTESISFSLDPDNSEIDHAVSTSKDYTRLIVGTYDVGKHPSQEMLIKKLYRANSEMIVVSIMAPYDLLFFPKIPCFLATYGTNPLTLNALARVLVGLERPGGKIPVELPGLFPIGYGL